MRSSFGGWLLLEGVWEVAVMVVILPPSSITSVDLVLPGTVIVILFELSKLKILAGLALTCQRIAGKCR